MPKRSSAADAIARSAADGRAEQAAVGGAAHQHHRLDREGEGRDVGLRHIGDARVRARAANSSRAAAVDQRRAGERRQQAEQRLEQRGLAAAVGAEQRQHLALLQAHVEPAADHAVAIADAEIAAARASRPGPLHAGEQPDEERRADDGRQDAERNLDRRRGARQRVDEAGDSRRRAAPTPAAAVESRARPAPARDAAPPARPSR